MAKDQPQTEFGIFVGVRRSNEIMVADANGDVVKTRAFARVTAAHRWDFASIDKVRARVGEYTAIPPEGAAAGHIEEQADPHVDGDAQEREMVDQEVDTGEQGRRPPAFKGRITNNDLHKYGYRPFGCPRCDELQEGNVRTW